MCIAVISFANAMDMKWCGVCGASCLVVLPNGGRLFSKGSKTVTLAADPFSVDRDTEWTSIKCCSAECTVAAQAHLRKLFSELRVLRLTEEVAPPLAKDSPQKASAAAPKDN